MMRWSGFAGALGFGAVAAVAVLLLGPLLVGLLGTPAALRVGAVGLAVLYVAGLGACWRHGFGAAIAAAGAGLVLIALPFGVPATVLGAAAIVSACRSGVLYRARPLRGTVAELLLQAGGLGLAGFLVGSTHASLALAVWGYFLAQSAFFVIGGVRARGADRGGDAFERARAELLALLG